MESHHTEKKQVLDRLSRAIGHLEAIRRMVEADRDCAEVLVQVAAVRTAVNNIGKIILIDHINHCVVDAARTGDQQTIDELNRAITQFVK